MNMGECTLHAECEERGVASILNMEADALNVKNADVNMVDDAGAPTDRRCDQPR